MLVAIGLRPEMMMKLSLLWRNVVCVVFAAAAANAAHAQAASPIEAQARALKKAHAAVVGVQSQAVPDARSAATLGLQRRGSGIVIDADGLVLTIGYLILEAEHVELLLEGERVVPAKVVAYDVATGFGLLQPLAPLHLEPVSLGESAALSADEPLMIASGGDDGDVSVARMVSRRAFSAFWEYHIDGALFTSPPRPDHSGAALINGRGELVGIGSLMVADALGDGREKLPGNMFVPVDLLKPVLGEMRERGSSRRSARAWIGLNCVEHQGEVRVVRVNDDSPADVAGLQPGDHIVRIDGAPVVALKPFYEALWSGGAPEREIRLVVQRDGQAKEMKVQAVDRMKTLRRAGGI